ncbi:MAG: hypothetical protein WBP80_15155, partial [Planifilum fulgidum]
GCSAVGRPSFHYAPDGRRYKPPAASKEKLSEKSGGKMPQVPKKSRVPRLSPKRKGPSPGPRGAHPPTKTGENRLSPPDFPTEGRMEINTSSLFYIFFCKTRRKLRTRVEGVYNKTGRGGPIARLSRELDIRREPGRRAA